VNAERSNGWGGSYSNRFSPTKKGVFEKRKGYNFSFSLFTFNSVIVIPHKRRIVYSDIKDGN